uniref:PET hydrolase/cutinase-like domain-containing protein n=1 Tax=Pyrodinium bahamense TaxID=73915 RepID=A0A7S0B5H7_9DINO
MALAHLAAAVAVAGLEGRGGGDAQGARGAGAGVVAPLMRKAERVAVSVEAGGVGGHSQPLEREDKDQLVVPQGVFKQDVEVFTDQRGSSSTLSSARESRVVAGVNITMHNPLRVKRNPEDMLKWVITLPETCTDADVHAFAADMPTGAKSLFLGAPSNTGLPCVFVMEGTEAQLHEELEGHRGALSAQAELSHSEESASTTGNPEGLPENEGLPDVPSRLLPEHRRRPPSLAETDGSDGYWEMVSQTNIDIPGPWSSACGGPYKANVFYPKQIHQWAPVGKHPVVSVGHGYTQYGMKVESQLVPGFIKPLVTWGGYVVIAHQTVRGWCDSSNDILFLLGWIQKSVYAAIIDPTRAAVVGYSMGARFSLQAASSDANVNTYHLKAVVALMPPCKSGCPISKVPTFFGAGSADTTCPAEYVKQVYDQTYGVPKVWCNVQGAPHWEVGTWGANRHEANLLRFLGCYLWNSKVMCDKLFAELPGYRPPED